MPRQCSLSVLPVLIGEMEMAEQIPHFPNVEVQLSGQDGNAFSILGRVRRALADAGAKPEEIQGFTEEAQSGDYDHLLQTVMRWVQVS